MKSSTRVAIIGVGNVGASTAYALLMSGVAGEIVLIDANPAKAEGEAMDLEHALPFTPPTRIFAGDYTHCATADVIVITAGVGRKPGDSRLDLARNNVAIVRQIVPQIVAQNPSGVIVVATNPVDVLTYNVLKISGLDPRRVIGSGTILDTVRFRFMLSEYFGVDPHSVHAHIIGEHGDTEVPVWSLANIAGMHLASYCRNRGMEYDREALHDIFIRTRDAGAAVIKRKGATFYAIAISLSTIIAAILRDQNTVFSLSSLIDGYYGISDVCLSLPSVLHRSGIKEVLHLSLSAEEADLLRHSADVLRANIAACQEVRI